MLQGRQLRGGEGNVTLLCNNGFRVEMLEVNNLVVNFFGVLNKFFQVFRLGCTRVRWEG